MHKGLSEIEKRLPLQIIRCSLVNKTVKIYKNEKRHQNL